MESLIDCSKARTLAAVHGAAITMLGFDGVVRQLPPQVHWALAGVAVDVWCRGVDMNNIGSEMM